MKMEAPTPENVLQKPANGCINENTSAATLQASLYPKFVDT